MTCLTLSFGCFFFFQAEDGIRDLVWSRGLGDVYKRQELEGVGQVIGADRVAGGEFADERIALGEIDAHQPVSYTHLTLPTSDLV